MKIEPHLAYYYICDSFFFLMLSTRCGIFLCLAIADTRFLWILILGNQRNVHRKSSDDLDNSANNHLKHIYHNCYHSSALKVYAGYDNIPFWIRCAGNLCGYLGKILFGVSTLCHFAIQWRVNASHQKRNNIAKRFWGFSHKSMQMRPNYSHIWRHECLLSLVFWCLQAASLSAAVK